METVLTFNIGVSALVIGIAVFFFSLLAVIWKGKSEIAAAIKDEISPFRNIANAITEIQTIIRSKFKGINIIHTMTEQGSSPLNPTEYGAYLMRESGLEKILNENTELLCTKLRASLPNDYTEYDVQEKARQVLLDLKDDQIMNPVKEWVYQNPTEIETVLRTGGLWLRDDFLKQPRKISEKQKEKK